MGTLSRIIFRVGQTWSAYAHGKYFHNFFDMSEKETCKAHTLDLAKYGDIVNIENGNSYGNGSFIATPTAARPAIFHISSCRALVVVRTVGVAEKITLNG